MEKENLAEDGKKSLQNARNFIVPIGIIAIVFIFFGSWFYSDEAKKNSAKALRGQGGSASLEEIAPEKGVELPVKWNDLGKKMVEAGVIDKQKFDDLYGSRGGLGESGKRLVYGEENGNLVIDRNNSGLALNLLWALGLGSKNPILENGPMSDKQFGGAGNFASTGGWTLSKGSAMEHYSRHSFISLSLEQQKIVERAAQNIYRPCCDNSTYFPDCNHGMAMLGLLELMVSQGVSEDELYKIALKVNSYWFPDNYLAIANYLSSEGILWKSVNPKDILGASFSSASGYREIMSKMEPTKQKGGASCSA